MIETIDNTIQIVLVAFSFVFALVRAVSTHLRKWVLASMFFGTYFLGLIYWTLMLIFYQDATFTYISDLCWYATYLFLLLMLFYLRNPKRKWKYSNLLFLVPVFTTGMGIFFMLRGDIINNIIYILLMTMLLWQSVNGLFYLKGKKGAAASNRWIYTITLIFCFLEYALWTASCFWLGDTLINPYFWFDFLLSVCFVLFLPAIGKAGDE